MEAPGNVYRFRAARFCFKMGTDSFHLEFEILQSPGALHLKDNRITRRQKSR
jgi:hypothetical protein